MSKIVVDVSDKSRNVYLDTSIYNRLLDDAERDRIIGLIKQKNLIVIPSVANLCELLMTTASDRRTRLLRVYNEIRNGFHPLKPSPWLLRESVEAVHKGLDEMGIVYPIDINDETENICRELIANKGSELELYLQGARKYILEAAQSNRFSDDVNFFAYIDSESGQKNMVDLFDQICTALGKACDLDEVEKLAIIRSSCSPWKYYLESYVYLFYRRAFPDVGYGKRANPGPSDVEQCTYLFWPGYFIVEDGIFLGFLKSLKKIRTYPVEIMDYSEFREFLFHNEDE